MADGAANTGRLDGILLKRSHCGPMDARMRACGSWRGKGSREASTGAGGELTPCQRMDEVRAGLRELMRPDWRGGVFAQVLDDAVISVGDPVSWEPRKENRA